VLKAYKYRIYPRKTQKTLIEKPFGSTRILYNYFLDYRQKKCAKDNKKVCYMITQSELTKLKKLNEYKWLSFTAPQNIKVANNRLYLANFTKDGLKVKLHRDIVKNATLKQATISRQFISILIDDNISIANPTKAKTAVGLDMGITHHIIISDRVKYLHNRHYNKLFKLV